MILQKSHVRHILIVEDSQVQAMSLKLLLESENFEVSWVSDGPEAIEQAQSLKFDLIVLDVELPTLNGYETCRRLKADPATAAIPVIMLTSHDHPLETLAGLESGSVDYIPKDAFAHATLVGAIRQLNQGVKL